SIQRLLAAGAEPEMRDRLGRTTLHLVITSWPRVLTTQRERDSKFENSSRGRRMRAETCLRLLCEHGVNINAEVTTSRHTALHLSVQHRAVTAIHILASHGARVNAIDSGGMTPLHMAAGLLHKDIIASLIKEGADLNMVCVHSGNTPLHLAVVAVATKTTKTTTLDDDIGCITELLEHGAEVNAVNEAGMTPLQEVCNMGNVELVDLLLRYGANINKLSKAGENCLFMFLNHRPNVRNSALLLKLLNLTFPLKFYNHKGHLPSTLMLPCFFKQRDQLLKLIQQPRKLLHICKSAIYLKHVHDKREELRKFLPHGLYAYVFNYWEDLHISFVTDDEQDLNNAFNV
uniref:Uncharacterized protein n=1 Tax=Mola mola TaxID=94237 RepID=A0A3Q3VX21_MOLML